MHSIHAAPVYPNYNLSSKALFAACRKRLKPSNTLPFYAPDDHSKIRKAILKFSQEVKMSK
ncbi:hypothetical protein BEN74_01420 [Acinetobacter sp. WCHAc010034]|nr:hypothetical protein BEN74_01420 [Acinetobacter sp. WCHAc010034]